MRKFELYNAEWMTSIEDDQALEAYYDGDQGADDSLERRIGMQQELFESYVPVSLAVPSKVLLEFCAQCSMGRWDDEDMDSMMHQQMMERQMMEQQVTQGGYGGVSGYGEADGYGQASYGY